MAKLALAFDIIARDAGASKTFKDVGNSADIAGEKGTRFGGAMKSGMKIAGAAIAGLAVGAAVGLKSAVDEASNLGESVNAVNVVFGDAAAGVLKLSDNAAKAVGLSKSEFNGLAVQFSSFATKVAGPTGDVTSTLDELTGRAADFASVMNLDVSEAATIFQSALSGETEPIKKFGIDLSAAAVEAYAMANGIGTAGEALTETEKVQARYALLMAETSKTQGDFANTSDSLANRQRILGATFDNIKAQIGTALLPIMEDAFGFILDTAIPAVQGLITGFQDGTGAGGQIADVFTRVKDGAVATFEFFRDEALPRLQEFAGFVKTEVVPRLRDFGAFLSETVFPALQKVGGFLKDTFQPTFDALVTLFKDKVMPRLRELKATIDENRPALNMVAKAVGLVVAGLGWLVAKIAGAVLPVLVKLVGFVFDRVVGALTDFANAIGWGRDLMVDLAVKAVMAKVKFTAFMDKIKGFKLPGWVKRLADLVKDIAGGIGGAAGGVARFFGGDAPGSFRGVSAGGPFAGGNTLARVKGLLPSGAVITSTYRSPGKNATIPGSSSTSLHMDRNNPAVDIGGPTRVLDSLFETLRDIGGWRQLLWRVPNHFDHIHVAHAGGTVSSSWPRMPGDRWDERTARLQVGETINPKGGEQTLTGELYLDTGAFLGTVRGLVKSEQQADTRSVLSRPRR